MPSDRRSLPGPNEPAPGRPSLRDRLEEIWRVFYQSILALFLAMMLTGLLLGESASRIPYAASIRPEFALSPTAADLTARLRTGDEAAEFVAADDASRRRMVVALFADDVSRLRWTWDGRLRREEAPSNSDDSEP